MKLWRIAPKRQATKWWLATALVFQHRYRHRTEGDSAVNPIKVSDPTVRRELPKVGPITGVKS